MPQLLKLKKLTGIHFVDKGAAINPIVAFWKNNKQESQRMTLEEKVAKALSAIMDEVKKQDAPQPPNPQDPREVLMAVLDEAGLGEEAKAKILDTIAMLSKQEPPKPEEKKPEQPNPEQPKPEEEVEMQKKLDELPSEIKKAFAPVFEKQRKTEEALVETQKKLQEAETVVLKVKNEAELKAEIEIAKQFPFVPGDTEKRGALLLSVKKNLGEASYSDLITTLKAANEIAKSKTLDAPGSSRQAEGEGSAYAKLNAMAEEIQKNSKTKLSREQAFAKAAKANPQLYVDADKERLAIQ